MALADALSPPAAAAIVGAGLCVLAGLEAAVVLALDRAAEARRAAGGARRAGEALLAPLQEAGRLIGAKPLPSVLLAVAAGAVVALLRRRR